MIKVMRLKDGLDVEVEIDDLRAQEISFNKTLDLSINNIQSMLKQIIQPIAETFKDLSSKFDIDSTKVLIGVNIGIEGGFVLAKSSAGANIQVELTMRPSNG